MLPKHLVFCGGGTRCLVFLPTLLELEKHNRLTQVSEYWGTSAGALCAASLAICKSVARVKDVMFSINYQRFRDIDLHNIINISHSWGMDTGESLKRTIEDMFEALEPGSKHKTFRDVPGLHVIVADLNKHDTVILDHTTFPNLPVVDGVRASMGLPIMFCPYKHAESGHFWVDGAVRAHFPWDLLPNDAEREKALGFTFEKAWIGGPRTFNEYIFSMIHFDEPKKMEYQKARWKSNIIWYPTPPYPAWFVRLKKEDYDMLETIGSTIANQWITQENLSKTKETHHVSEDPNIPLPSSPLHHTNELLDIPQPFLAPSRDVSPHQLPPSSPSSRRWSV